MKKIEVGNKKFQPKNVEAEIEKPEEIEISSVEKNDEILVPDAEVEQDEETPEHIEKTAEPEPEIKPISENTEFSNKQKIKQISRSLENKRFTLEKERSKIAEWRRVAEITIKQTNETFLQKSIELEKMLKKAEEKRNKKINKYQKYWLDYSDNLEKTRINNIEVDILKLEIEMKKHQELLKNDN